MKKYILFLLSLNLLTINNRLFAQGSLTPPGPPGPTMKTLTQIEPRTPISTFSYISAPGSYYLTTNINCNLLNQIGISINASGVTLDLNGFTISSTGDYSTVANAGAIELASGLSDITIRNGHIRGGVAYNSGTGAYSAFGFGDGINYTGTQPVNILVSDVSVSGCLYYGINLGEGYSTVVDRCTVFTVGSYGIQAASTFRSTAFQCGINAIAGIIAIDSYGSAGEGTGIYVSQTADNCYGVSASGYGLSARNANNCYGICNSGYAVYSYTATGCYGYTANGEGVGIATTVAIGCYGLCNGNGSGIEAYIANSCYSSTLDGNIMNKYNMP